MKLRGKSQRCPYESKLFWAVYFNTKEDVEEEEAEYLRKTSYNQNQNPWKAIERLLMWLLCHWQNSVRVQEAGKEVRLRVGLGCVRIVSKTANFHQWSSSTVYGGAPQGFILCPISFPLYQVYTLLSRCRQHNYTSFWNQVTIKIMYRIYLT